MACSFYARRADQVRGPFTAEQLREMAATGALCKTDEVRVTDQAKWYVADAVKGLFPDKKQSIHPMRQQTKVRPDDYARLLTSRTEGMIDIEAFEREQKRRVSARRKRLMLWAGATGGIAFIGLLVALPLSTVGVSSLNETSGDKMGPQQQQEGGQPALPQGVFERIFALADPALPENTRSRWLEENNSTDAHWDRMMQMGRKMIALSYDIAGSLPHYVAGGASHIKVADCWPYELEWRLAGVGGEKPNDVPVSFLSAEYDGEFDHDLAVAVVKEFDRINEGGIDLEAVKAAMHQADNRHRSTKTGDLNSVTSWLTKSDLQFAESLTSLSPEYAIRVDVREWPREEYTREHASTRVLVYFVFLPPGKDIDLTKVYSSGFGIE